MSTDKKISQLSSGAPAQAGDEYVVARSGANYKLTLTNIAASMPATTITSGNLTFSGTAQRITGDFSNATLSNRLAFQTSTTNGNTIVGAFPNGTGLNARLQAFSASDPTNASTISFEANGAISQSAIIADKTGTGSYLPMTFSTGGSERVRIDTSGNVGIGGTAQAYTKLQLTGTLPTSGGSSVGSWVTGTIPSGTTGDYIGFWSESSTQAASFTLARANHFYTSGLGVGAGSTVTNQYGFHAQSTLTGATNNYGFYSGIASGSNRWNFYAAGTAANYFAGNTGVGAAAPSNQRLFSRGASATSSDYAFGVQNSTPADLFWIRNDGLIYTGLAGESPYNKTTGAGANMIVDSAGLLFRSTSSLRYKSDVTDATHGLADVLKLRSVTYKAKNDGDTVFGGLIAEEVHDAGLTEFVAYDKKGRPDAIHYGNMVALLVKAVQELTARVAELEAK